MQFWKCPTKRGEKKRRLTANPEGPDPESFQKRLEWSAFGILKQQENSTKMYWVR